jgi:hypothetical protein
MRLRTLCLLISIFLGSAAFADDDSGNDHERACRMAVTRADASNFYEAAKVGECLAAISTIIFLNVFLDKPLQYCPPKGATVGQHIKVVLKYMDDHPDQMNKNFVHLSLVAFNGAWPCQAK